MALLLQCYTQVSDAEAVELTAVDAGWQMVLDHLGTDEPAFSQGALCGSRSRLIQHDMDRRLLERRVGAPDEDLRLAEARKDLDVGLGFQSARGGPVASKTPSTCWRTRPARPWCALRSCLSDHPSRWPRRRELLCSWHRALRKHSTWSGVIRSRRQPRGPSSARIPECSVMEGESHRLLF